MEFIFRFMQTLWESQTNTKTNFQRFFKITVTDKADAKFLVVSAASICAKVMRHLILYLLIDVYITGKHIVMYLCVSATKIM